MKWLSNLFKKKQPEKRFKTDSELYAYLDHWEYLQM